MYQNWHHVCHCIVPLTSSSLFLHLVISTNPAVCLIDTWLVEYTWCHIPYPVCWHYIYALTGQRFNAAHYYATELYKQGHHLSVLQSSLSGIIECLLFKPFSSSSGSSSPPPCLLFSLYAKSQHPLFRPKKRRLLPCSTCVPSSGNAEQLEEMWSSSTCQRTLDSLSLKPHPWLLYPEKQTMEQYSGSGLSKQKARSLFPSPFLSFCLFPSCVLSAANGYPDVSQTSEVICPWFYRM